MPEIERIALRFINKMNSIMYADIMEKVRLYITYDNLSVEEKISLSGFIRQVITNNEGDFSLIKNRFNS